MFSIGALPVRTRKNLLCDGILEGGFNMKSPACFEVALPCSVSVHRRFSPRSVVVAAVAAHLWFCHKLRARLKPSAQSKPTHDDDACLLSAFLVPQLKRRQRKECQSNILPQAQLTVCWFPDPVHPKPQLRLAQTVDHPTSPSLYLSPSTAPSSSLQNSSRIQNPEEGAAGLSSSFPAYQWRVPKQSAEPRHRKRLEKQNIGTRTASPPSLHRQVGLFQARNCFLARHGTPHFGGLAVCWTERAFLLVYLPATSAERARPSQ